MSFRLNPDKSSLCPSPSNPAPHSRPNELGPAADPAESSSRDCCPICLEQLPALTWRADETSRMVCCGKEACAGCNRDFMMGRAERLANDLDATEKSVRQQGHFGLGQAERMRAKLGDLYKSSLETRLYLLVRASKSVRLKSAKTLFQFLPHK